MMVATTCPVPQAYCTLMTYLQFAMNYQSPADLQSPKQLQDSTEEFDFIIVGAGAAGCVLANRLSEMASWKVLLLEEGGEAPLEDIVPAFTPLTYGTRLNWNYTTLPNKYICTGEPCSLIWGRGLGGSTLHNAMLYNRGNRRTFGQWEQMGITGWSYKKVLPYFKKSENNLDRSFAKDKKYHGVGGPQSVGRFPYKDKNIGVFVDAFKEIGYPEIDFNAVNKNGVMSSQYLQKDGARQSASDAFLSPVRKVRQNLKVVTNVFVTKIIINKETKEAEGVEYVWDQDRKRGGKIYAKKEVIVSAGPFNSPQLLMLSGIGPRETLEPLGIPVISDLKVGYNLQNHFATFLSDFILPPEQSTLFMNVSASVSNYKRNKRGPLASIGVGGVHAYTNSRYAESNFPDIHYNFYPSTVYNDSNSEVAFITPYSFYNHISVRVANTRGRSRGRISINSTDPFSPPIIETDYFSDKRDLIVFKDGFDFIVSKLSKTKTLKDKGIRLDTTPIPACKDLEFGTNSYWLCLIRNGNDSGSHFGGTCKMGVDRTSVVDPELKVYNVGRLRVIDTSIQPILVTGNTNAVALMIGEKGADMIKEEHLKSESKYKGE